ncbi:MAG: sensor histidine kinase [Cohaesibacteraceae bacterium]|nr:sensor histidine kinase [Cohaesibacteraceae bacterium]
MVLVIASGKRPERTLAQSGTVKLSSKQQSLEDTKRRKLNRPRIWIRYGRRIGRSVVSSLTRRIVFLNLSTFTVLVLGILYLNQNQVGLIDSKVEALRTQGRIIAVAIASSSPIDSRIITIDPERLLELQAGESVSPYDSLEDELEFSIDPERVAPILAELISPTKTRARIYDKEGVPVLDSRHIYARGEVLRYRLSPPGNKKPGLFIRTWRELVLWSRRKDLPLYVEKAGENGKRYPEVAAALQGQEGAVVRVNSQSEIIVMVAVPVLRERTIAGVLLLSTKGGDIDSIIQAERNAILSVALVAATVAAILSILMASTIAGPMRRLASAAERVQRSVKVRHEIPDFSDRADEIGHLSAALRGMTETLYNRIEANERFAADVAHELKNPLTSLRSAVETLPLARTDENKNRLLEVIQHDIKRLDRLISDISDASRLDAELARDEAEPFDLKDVVLVITEIQNDLARDRDITISLNVEGVKDTGFIMNGKDSRIAQVLSNLIDNARSFAPDGGFVKIGLARKNDRILLEIDDSGPGIRSEKIERIFERFYTDRPDGEAFGQNSGLGLSISKQIVEAHGGTITAINRIDPDTGKIAGARFSIVFPTD